MDVLEFSQDFINYLSDGHVEQPSVNNIIKKQEKYNFMKRV
jgi:hypothetical protein